MAMVMISAVSADDPGEIDFNASDGMIHLSDRTYSVNNVTITQSVNVIGSNSSVFEPSSEDSLFTVTDGAQVMFENVKFKGFMKGEGSVFRIESSASLVLINCTFTDNAMAISNYGDLKIYDSLFNNNTLTEENSHGGAISNNGKLYVENTIFTGSAGPKNSRGSAIYNNGDLTLNQSTISNSYAGEDSKGSALFNNKECLMVDSIIENNMIERYNFNYMHGVVYNQGNLTATGNIFRNNSGKYVRPNTWYEGSPTIYNVGDIDLAYNAFIGNVYFKGLSVDVFNNGARHISLDANWWQTNDNPISAGKLNDGNEVTSWIVLDVTPEYSAVDINGSVLIKAGFKLNNGGEITHNLFSKFDISLSDGEMNYSDSFVFNRTHKKGQYTVTANVCGQEKTATVDVGKIPVYVKFNADENITFPEDLFIEFTSNVNANLTLTLNSKKYTVNVENNRANLTVKALDAGTYDLNVVYDGDDDHFRAFNQTRITVNKMPVTLTLENVSDIRTDGQLTAKIILNPNVSPVTAQLYINGVFTKTIYLYDGVNNLTFKNMEEGRYNVTVLIAQTENYFAANATAVFNVGRYDPQLSVNVNDINMGENATALIKANNFTGNVVLSINGVNVSVFIQNDTNITIPNLAGGWYSVSLIFKGDSQYLPSNSTASFRVIRSDPDFRVNITRDDKKATIHISTNENATGQVGVYINFEKYTCNLTDGSAVFNVSLDGGTNYVFAFYGGDVNFENKTYNTTIIIDEDFMLIGGDVEAFEYNDFTYSVVLVEKNRITMPDRNVSITFNGKIYNVVTDNDGRAGITLNLPAGTYSIKASYLNQTVTASINVRAVDYELKTQNIEFGETECVEAIFKGNITGHVNFKISDADVNVDVISSKAVLNISDLKIERYTVNATYFNGNFTSKTISSSFEVRRAVPKVNVNALNIVPGERERIEIIFSNSVTGYLTVNVNNVDYKVEIKDSKAVLNINDLEIGVYEVLITYGGNENFTAFTCSTVFSVRNQSSHITLNIENVYYGENLLINAILIQTATGNVTFSVSDMIKTVNLVDGQAECVFAGLGAGTYRVDAEYGGDLKFKASSTYGFFRVLKANSTITIVTDEVELGENIMIYAKLPADATGEVYFSMIDYYTPRAKKVNDGSAFWYISPLEAGKYTIIAAYTGDANYNPSNVTFTLKVSQVKSVLQATINDASINDRVTVSVKLCDVDSNPISGNVTLTLNGKSYNVNVINGIGSLVLGRMASGSYVFQTVYEGSEDYSTSSVSGSFIVADNLLESSLTAENVTAFYKGRQLLKINLTSNSKPIAQAVLNIKVNNKVYSISTDNSGIANLDLNLNPGTYKAEIAFDETLSHKASKASAVIRVVSTINATDVVKLYGSGTQYFAVFYTSEGSALGNTEVSFILNSKTYKVKTLPNGVVRLNININPGSYKITAINPQTKEKVVSNLRIYAKIMENKDLTQYYGANKSFKVRIYNATTAKAVGQGVKVTFKVNKKTYTVKTDKKGYASLKIKLKAGKYTITTRYAGYKVSNKITVKPVLTASNIIGKNIKTLKFNAKLVSKKGKPLKGKSIKFKFKGKTYSAKTNGKGIATVMLKNLKAGNYKILSSYGKSKITNTIKIR